MFWCSSRLGLTLLGSLTPPSKDKQKSFRCNLMLYKATHSSSKGFTPYFAKANAAKPLGLAVNKDYNPNSASTQGKSPSLPSQPQPENWYKPQCWRAKCFVTTEGRESVYLNPHLEWHKTITFLVKHQKEYQFFGWYRSKRIHFDWQLVFPWFGEERGGDFASPDQRLLSQCRRLFPFWRGEEQDPSVLGFGGVVRPPHTCQLGKVTGTFLVGFHL